MLRGLGRLDVFPPGDVGAMRRLRTLLQLGPQAPLDDVVERFGKHRGYLYFYALGGSLLSQGLIEPAPGAKAGAPARAGPEMFPSAAERQHPGRGPE
jgi:DNA-3-methyladenine glycosylase II